jgi:aminopyrrolnitrin oxygenase
MPGAAAAAKPFPSWPVGWYTVARGDEIARRQILPLALGAQQLVIFRTAAGKLHALAAHCPHMGTHLRHGEVQGEELRCPMHHWLLDGTGVARSAGAPCGQSRTWPVAERFGLVLVFLGPGPAPPLPEPAAAEDYTWQSGGPLAVSTAWSTLMISAFDMEHLRAVHHRQLRTPPAIEIDSAARAVRLRYVSTVNGGDLADRVMGWLGRHGIEVTMTCGGPTIVVETRMGRRRTSAFLGLLPHGTGVRAFGSFGVPRGSWLSALQLRIAGWLFLAFLRKDFAIIEGMALRTDVRDVGVQAMHRFLTDLPEAEGV